VSNLTKKEDGNLRWIEDAWRMISPVGLCWLSRAVLWKQISPLTPPDFAVASN